MEASQFPVDITEGKRFVFGPNDRLLIRYNACFAFTIAQRKQLEKLYADWAGIDASRVMVTGKEPDICVVSQEPLFAAGLAQQVEVSVADQTA